MAVITMLTDFGTRDPYVGIMKGVILGLDPEARIVDLSHEVEAGDLVGGGFVLAEAWHWFPRGTIHLAVVDPGVGTDRKPLLAQADGHYFVGPDNGLFTAALDAAREVFVRELAEAAYRLEPVSQTFHGRDIFAPAAAWLSRGISCRRMGPPLNSPVRASWLPELVRERGGVLRGAVVHVDSFGNVITNISRAFLEGVRRGVVPLVLEWTGGRSTRLVETYAEAPADEPVLLFGSSGYLEIAVNRGNAAERTGIRRGDEVRLC